MVPRMGRVKRSRCAVSRFSSAITTQPRIWRGCGFYRAKGLVAYFFFSVVSFRISLMRLFETRLAINRSL